MAMDSKQGAAKPKPPTPFSLPAVALVLVALPFCATVATIFMFGSSLQYRAMAKPFWFPPLWVMHMGSMGCSVLMGVAAWAVWAEGGLRVDSAALPLYLSHVCLGIMWEPLVVALGAARLAAGSCVVHFGTLVACHSAFRDVKPVVGELVKPCLAWVAILTFLTFKLTCI